MKTKQNVKLAITRSHMTGIFNVGNILLALWAISGFIIFGHLYFSCPKRWVSESRAEKKYALKQASITEKMNL